MQKISPLKAGLDAFNKFKAARLTSKSDKTKSGSTNPFGISFKGAALQMDVFETSNNKTSGATNPISDGWNKMNKFVASARVATMNKLNSVKENIVSFGRMVKQNTVGVYNKLATTEVNFDFMKNSTSRLQKLPVSELETMFRKEISGLEG